MQSVVYPKLKICSKIFDYKFDRSDSFYGLKTTATIVDMAVLSTSFGGWKSEKNWVFRKNSEMFVASGLRGCGFLLLFSIDEATLISTSTVQERCGHTKMLKGLEHLTLEKS